ncbi:peptidase dimerization domain-containing protein [Candidatus Aerophobetes bacterium]|nr:peptidase dimerization domain-containing protein [Candidatus Aerophobetes bacterium]
MVHHPGYVETNLSYNEDQPNVIGKLFKIYQRLVDLDRECAERNYNPFFEKMTGRSCNLNVGTFKAGKWPSTVPGWAQLEARISYLLSETIEQVKEEVKNAIRGVTREDSWMSKYPPEIEWFGWFIPWIQKIEVPLIQQFQKTASEVLLYSPDIIGAPWGLDNRFTSFLRFLLYLYLSDLEEDFCIVLTNM